MNKPDNDTSLIDLASDNPDLKHKIAVLLSRLESTGIADLESQISVLIINMMNFFASKVEEIPSFDSLPLNLQQIFLKKFKKVAHNLKNKKIKSIDEMLQTFLFTILNNIGAREEFLGADEILNKRSKRGFKSFLRKAASHEIYTITNENQTTEKNQEKNFIHDSVLLDVKNTMKNVGLELSSNNVNNRVSIFKQAHKKAQHIKLRQK